MARSTYSTSYNPAAGAKTDFEKLLAKFAETGNVRFEEFSAIWREMKMSLIFAGRQDDQECREFTEESLRIAVEFWMPPYSFQTRIGALYLLYGLYSKQLFKLKAKICVTLPQWKEALLFFEEIQRQQHLDVEYIFKKLRNVMAFHFVATTKQIYPRMPSAPTNVEVTETPGGRTRTLMESEVGSLTEIVTLNTLAQLSAIHSEYHRMKCEMAGPTAKRPNSSLDLITANLPETFDKLLSTFEDWKKANRGRKRRRRKDVTNSDPESDEDEFLPSAVQKKRIKEKAFQNVTKVSRSRRHRQVVVAEDKPEASPKKQGRRGHSKGTTSESEGREDALPRDTPTTLLQLSDTTGEFLSMPTFSHDDGTEMKSTESKARKQGCGTWAKYGSGKSRSKKSAKVPGKTAKGSRTKMKS